MHALDFFRLVLPPEGVFFIALPKRSGKGMVHHAFTDHAQLAAAAATFDLQGETVYYALSSFRQEKLYTGETWSDGKPKYRERTQDNVRAVKAFWLDVDVGPAEVGKPPKYATQEDALAGVAEFLKETGLPQPIVVSSGFGFHVYWPLTEALGPDAWLRTARQLKGLTVACGTKVDPTRTADSASVLRPPGAHHRKSNPPRPVVVLLEGEPTDTADFVKRIETATRAHGVQVEKVTGSIYQSLNEGAGIARTYERTDANLIADRCAQVRAMRDSRGQVSEPVWYAAIGVLRYSKQAPEIIHDWSNGHPQYDKAETDRKIKQWADRKLGPTTCSEFQAKNAPGCDGCAFREKGPGRLIYTPHQLGVEVQRAPLPKIVIGHDAKSGAELEVELPDAPAPFIRGAGENPGLYVDHNGVPIKFYDYDLFPVQVNRDEWKGEETVTIRHWLPQEGWLEFDCDSRLLESPKDLNMRLRSQSVQPAQGPLKDMPGRYVDEYIRKLKGERKLRRLHTAMGWQEDGFVVGDLIYTPDGARPSGISSKIASIVKDLKPHGNLAEWVKGTAILDRPELVDRAFAMLVAFGAPLMKLRRSHPGLLLNMTGATGVGKTTIAKLMMSVYGQPDDTKQNNNSTLNNRIERIGAFNNLPVFIDEVSNMEPRDVSELVYSISSGEGRGRLNKDASFKEVASWSTLAVSTSNHSLYGKLLSFKDAPDAETMRVLEWEVTEVEGDWAERLNILVRDHYGLAGPVFLEYLVKHQAEAVAMADQIEELLREPLGYQPKERFWFAAMSSMYAGGLIAKSLGLIAFNPLNSLRWFAQLLQTVRGTVVATHSDAIDSLATYLDETLPDRLTMVVEAVGGKVITRVEKVPSRALLVRVERAATGVSCWLAAGEFRRWAARRGLETNRIADELRRLGVLKLHTKRRLGAGTNLDTGPVNAWVLDLSAESVRGRLEAVE